MKEEIWKYVKEYPNRFMISDHGRLKSVKSGRILSQHHHKTGYFTHATKIGGKDGKAILLRIHRLVAEAFLPEPSEELKAWAKNSFYGIIFINHKDGNKLNNAPENLEWCNGSYNTKHAIEMGMLSHASQRGTKNVKSTLSKDDVAFVRENYGKLTARELADRFGVHHCTIIRCANGTRYKED